MKTYQELSEENNRLMLKISQANDIEGLANTTHKGIKALLRSLPKGYLVKILKELKIIKQDYVTGEITER